MGHVAQARLDLLLSMLHDDFHGYWHFGLLQESKVKVDQDHDSVYNHVCDDRILGRQRVHTSQCLRYIYPNAVGSVYFLLDVQHSDRLDDPD